MRLIRRAVAVLAVVALAATLAACGGGSSDNGGKKKNGGTVTLAWTATPNNIFPLVSASNTDGYNANLIEHMWPYLVYSGNGGKAEVDPKASLFDSIKYTNGNKKITIALKHWNWSDGKPITSRDFTFVYNMLKAVVPDWGSYLQGLFPDNVDSVKTPDQHTVVINLSRSFNPDFYTDDVLSEVPLLPQHAWDKTSASGKVGDYDTTTAGAKKVVKFLRSQGKKMSDFTSNPLWKVVDGPWKLSEFKAGSGEYTYVPNKQYSGPEKPHLAKVINKPFTTDTAILNALRAGNTIDVGTLPSTATKQLGLIKAQGYESATQPIPGVSGINLNFHNADIGPLVSQLYIRQAMEYLINRKQIVDKAYDGYADPANGPIGLKAGGTWVSPLEKSGGPYRYNPAKATSLLKAHGWTVKPKGTTTCQSPGTGPSNCGAGIKKGEALTFQLAYSSGNSAVDLQEAAIKSSMAQAGITLKLKSEPFNTLIATVGSCTAKSHPKSKCGWQLVYFGYNPYDLYPVGAGLFDTGGSSNQGGYSDAKMDRLIKATEYGGSAQTFYQYEDYAAKQLPLLWTPLRTVIRVYDKDLHGVAPLNPFSGGDNFQRWYYTS